MTRSAVNTDPQLKPTAVEERTRALFDESVEQLDGRTRSRLTQARYAAVEELRKQRAQPWRKTLSQAWLPLSGAAAAAVLAVWMTVSPVGQDSLNNGIARDVPLDELDLVAGQANIELLEDVEFYAWIAQQSASGGAGGYPGGYL
jgi:negative regulator of sigma E activity